MAATTPLLVTVQVLKSDMVTDSGNAFPLPDAMKVSIRPDIINFVHFNISKNSRQPYVVSRRAGRGASESTYCGGGMFTPTRIWRRWHRKIHAN